MQALYRVCIPEISPGRLWAYKVAVTGVPFQRVAMDIIGPFSKTAKGNMFVLIIGDYFTKWVEAYPMSDTEATTVAKCLYDFICRFGAPDTDQGRNFESVLISELWLLWITKTRTTQYHSQSDGMNVSIEPS